MATIEHRRPVLAAVAAGAFLLVASMPVLAERAGRVLFVAGEVTALDLAGNARVLERGGNIEEGDTIATHDGRLQIQFKDGGFLALQPNSRVKVAQYRFTAAGDAQDSVVMSLLKGGLRTISGLVGKKARNAYRMETAVATIGIRGTDYALELDAGLAGHVSDGAIEVCNGAGCTLVNSGFAFSVPSFLTPPVLSERRAFLPPPSTDRKHAGSSDKSDDATGAERDRKDDHAGTRPRKPSATAAQRDSASQTQKRSDPKLDSAPSRAAVVFEPLPPPGAIGGATLDSNTTGAVPGVSGVVTKPGNVVATPGGATAGPRSGNTTAASGQPMTATTAPSAVTSPITPRAGASLPLGPPNTFGDPLGNVTGPSGQLKTTP